MIQQARSSTSVTEFPNVSYRESSAESLPFLGDESVDMVVAGQAAHWFNYPSTFLEMKRVVREGGTLAFWGYGDHVFVDSPQATEVLRHYAYGNEDMLLGPYWSQPGRSIVEKKLRGIEPPLADWENVERIEYEPGVKGVRPSSGTLFLRKKFTLGECMSYIRTWSSFHAWQEAHPGSQSRENGGQGDVIDEMFDRMRSVEPSWQLYDWKEKEAEVEYTRFPRPISAGSMPPFIARKRRRSSSSVSPAPATTKGPQKPTLFDAADERPTGSLKANQDFVKDLAGSDSDSTLSDVSNVEFEDIAPSHLAKRQKLDHPDEEEDDNIDWEDAVHQDNAAATPSSTVREPADLELTLDKATRGPQFINDQKKGPSKIERQIRVTTHCIHVQYLMFHNMTRSRFASDAEVQKILVGQLPPAVKKEIDTWKLASGLPQEAPSEDMRENIERRGRRRKSDKGDTSVRSQRDWGKPAERQERGAPNMSRGDPVIRILKVLAAYWKKNFTVAAPSLRKQGYKSISRLEAELASFKNDKHDSEEHGERVESLTDFRNHATRGEGSRDVGVQLFVALLRGLGIEARLVSSLQPVGFGWNKNEEANAKKKRAVKADVSHEAKEEAPAQSTDRLRAKTTPRSNASKKSNCVNGTKAIPVDPSDTSSSELSSAGEDDESIIDVTPSTPRKRPNMPYDRDLVFPTCWAEAISPITHEVYPVDPFILTPAVAANPEHLAAFESRGPRADKAKQVFAYVIAFSPDSTAKDVTTRYLRRHMWPGRTKGVRLPVEKVPIYNKRGKIKHHEEYDWFKTIMSGYTRPDFLRTAVDDIEEAKDLKVVKAEKKESKAKEGTLQFYKTSAEFVLERHLRREEAIVPGAEPVRYFATGKGDESKDEPVFLRKDVMICRTGESWHKEGRQIKANQTPMKMVPIRAVTLTRKREVEEAERDGGEKLKQGLYAWEQTDWIIPPAIVDGVIPKNAYGNMDCFVPTMVPKGAAHIALRSTAKICKRLGIDFAEAVTGFEFGKQRAVPVVSGVVVAEENREKVIEEWEKDEEERRIKEEGKREKAALAMWKKFVVGLRIIERVRGEYGAAGEAHKEEVNPFTNRKKQKKKSTADEGSGRDEPMGNIMALAGGFIVDDESVSDVGPRDEMEDMAGGFVVDDGAGSEAGGGFLPDGYDEDQDGPMHSNKHLGIEQDTAVKSNGVLRSPAPERVENQAGSSSGQDSHSATKYSRRRKARATPKSTSRKKASHKSSTKQVVDDGSASPIDQPARQASPKVKRSVSKKVQLPEETPKRRTPRRKAAQAVKSPYFEKETMEDDDDD
ncbi:MAG: hypothetical protein Q9183_000214 [Haloplaca sp. 2 TL-2023]